MATSQGRVSSPQKNKGKRRERALPREKSGSRKLTIKYIVLDTNDSFTRITHKGAVERGALYQVSEYHKKDEEYVFTKVKNLGADLILTLTAEQYKILEKLIAVMDYESIEEYVNVAVLSIMKADADHSLSGVPREEALKVLEELKK